MSPEQAQGEAHTADRRSDVYSLGVILFQLLTNELPFRGNARMLLHQVIHDDPPSPRQLNANVSKDLETIVLKCLEKNADRRFTSANELKAELDRYLSGKPILSRPAGPLVTAWRWCRRHPTGLSAAGAGLLMLTTSGLFVVLHQRNRAEAAAAEARVAAQEVRKQARAAYMSNTIAEENAIEALRQKRIAEENAIKAMKEKRIADHAASELTEVKAALEVEKRKRELLERRLANPGSTTEQ